jgi:hypothetical protein
MLVRMRKKSLAILVIVGALPVSYMLYFIVTSDGKYKKDLSVLKE